MNKIEDEKIGRVLAGKAGRSKAGSLARWLATDEGQSYLSERMDAEFFNGEGNIEEKEACEESGKKVFRRLQKQISRKRYTRVVLKITAMVTPVAAVVALLLYLNTQVSLFEPPAYQDIYVPKGEQMQVAFQDGTRVYLYPGSHLRYPVKFSLAERRVTLDGEAYFEVSKNPHRPFMVELDKASVKVTGTSFHVQAYAYRPDITVGLDEGKVDLLYGHRQSYSLNPGESLTYNKEKESCMLWQYEGENALTRWREQEIVFRNTPLQEVLDELDLHYGIPFCVEDTAAYRYSYTLSMKKPSLEEVINTLEVISSVRFEEGDTIRVRMKQH